MAYAAPPTATNLLGASVPASLTVGGSSLSLTVGQSFTPVAVTLPWAVDDPIAAVGALDSLPAAPSGTFDYTPGSSNQLVFNGAPPNSGLSALPSLIASPEAAGASAPNPVAPPGQCRITAYPDPYKYNGNLVGKGTADCNTAAIVSYEPSTCIQKQHSFLFFTYWANESGCDSGGVAFPFFGVVYMTARHHCAPSANSHTWRTEVTNRTEDANHF